MSLRTGCHFRRVVTNYYAHCTFKLRLYLTNVGAVKPHWCTVLLLLKQLMRVRRLCASQPVRQGFHYNMSAFYPVPCPNGSNLMSTRFTLQYVVCHFIIQMEFGDLGFKEVRSKSPAFGISQWFIKINSQDVPHMFRNVYLDL